ncbi:MAG: hypothetical protein ACHQE6_04745 [Solirubrobacterales bacterium]
MDETFEIDTELTRDAIFAGICGWDRYAGVITTKNGKDRMVPIAGALRDYLDEHLLSLEWRPCLSAS